MTTKPEELARQLRDMSVDYEHEDSDQNKMQHEMLVAIQTALKPLLDALVGAKKAIHSLLNDGGEAQYSKAQAAIDEQLSQWRKK